MKETRFHGSPYCTVSTKVAVECEVHDLVSHSLENDLHLFLWRIFLGGFVHDVLKKAAPLQSARASEYGVLTEVERIIAKARVLDASFPENRGKDVVVRLGLDRWFAEVRIVAKPRFQLVLGEHVAEGVCV